MKRLKFCIGATLFWLGLPFAALSILIMFALGVVGLLGILAVILLMSFPCLVGGWLATDGWLERIEAMSGLEDKE